jgi:hypothetical protein
MTKTNSLNKSLPYRIFRFYYEGFREMTWGRVLWVLIFVKLFILFFVLRLFFFTPYLQGDEDTKRQTVGRELIERCTNN